MKAKKGMAHEPDTQLLSAEDAIRDAQQLQELFRQRRQAEQPVPLRVPLRVLLEALDSLDQEALREIARRAEERLSAVAHAP